MKKSVFIALVIMVLATCWVLSGVFGTDRESASSQVSGTEQVDERSQKLTEVRVQDLSAEPMNDEMGITGRTQASRQVYLRTKTDGQIISIFAKKGETVTKGQVLAKLETLDRAAKVLESEQLLIQREIQYKAAKELFEKGFSSRVRLAEAKAQLESAKAKLKHDRVELSHITVKAPFNSIINDQMVEVGDYVSKGNDMFDLVDLNPIEIVGFLTEKQMEYAVEGMPASIELLHGEKVDGVITFIAAAANRDTRTFKIEITVPNEDRHIKEGLTAKIKIPVIEDSAYKISPSILSLAEDGTIGVKTVNANNIVEFKPIRLLKDTVEYLWIGGLPDNIRIITVGQEFVISGQEVTPVLVER